MATLLAAGLVSLAGCEYLLILALHRTASVDLRYEGVMGLGSMRLVDEERWCMRLEKDTVDPNFVFVRIRITNEVDISSSGAVALYCTEEGKQQEFGDWLLRRHPAYEDVYCEALAFGHHDGKDSRDEVRLHGSYLVGLRVGFFWNRLRGETRETFLRRPFGLRCQIRGGKMVTLTLRSNEVVVPAADLVKAVSAYREPERGSR